jgi:2-(1,2-epoxy-1,2-dihydrophenyl)acetyl-CoA isomerase
VAEVVADGRLSARAAELASTLAALPTRALGMTKRLLERAALSSLDEQLELEAELQAEAARSEDFREGVNAFLEKREPRFTGR